MKQILCIGCTVITLILGFGFDPFMPIGNVIADNGGQKQGNVIVKCAESIGIEFDDQGHIVGTISDEIAGFTPTVVMVEATFGEPESCDSEITGVAHCGECLTDFINLHRCRADIAYPGSPMVIHRSSSPIHTIPNGVLFLSITEYVFQCSHNVVDDRDIDL